MKQQGQGVNSRRFLKWLVLFALIGTFAAGMMGYLAKPITLLQSEKFSLQVAHINLTLYDVAKGLLAVTIMFWLAAIIADLIESRIGRLRSLRSSTRTLVIKLLQIGVYFIAFLMLLDVLGIDLTALAVFSGALGIGLGFGLQKIASNFMSGLILLLEKTIEEDDLIELNDGTAGFIRRTGARFTLIETFDSKEIMVPNEDFITNRVTNWTYTNKRARVEVKAGISYASDTHKAMQLMVEAAKEHPLCSKDPEPEAFLREFGDSSVNLLLFFWVDDVTEGRYRPQSQVMLAIQDKFRANGIEIPFPQRDLHIKNPEALKEVEDAE